MGTPTLATGPPTPVLHRRLVGERARHGQVPLLHECESDLTRRTGLHLGVGVGVGAGLTENAIIQRSRSPASQ